MVLDSNISTRPLGLVAKNFNSYWDTLGGPKMGVSLSLRQTLAFRNALRESLRKLGIEDFQTRTGYTFEFGQRVLGELDATIGSESATD